MLSGSFPPFSFKWLSSVYRTLVFFYLLVLTCVSDIIYIAETKDRFLSPFRSDFVSDLAAYIAGAAVWPV